MNKSLDSYLEGLSNTTVKVHRSILRRYMLTINSSEPDIDSAVRFLVFDKARGLSITSLGVTKNILERFLSWYCNSKVELNCPWITVPLNEHAREYQAKRYIYGKQNGLRIRIIGNRRDKPSGTCELCNKSAKRLSYHHWDDERSMKGLWLCGWCHTRVAEPIEKKGIGGILQLVERYVILKAEIDLTYGQS